MPIKVTDDNFKEEVLEADNLVLVDFWAAWCNPCKQMESVVEKLDENVEELKVTKLNVDDNKKTASKYGINGIPSLAFFEDGEVVNKLVGVRPYEKLEQVTEELL